MAELPRGQVQENSWVVLPIYPESDPPSARQAGVVILLEGKDSLYMAFSDGEKWVKAGG